MLTFLFRAIPALLLLGLFGYVLFNLPYPNSLTQATFFQLTAFLGSLFLVLFFLINIFLASFLVSLPIALGLIIVLILQGLESLNIASAALVLISIGLLASYFRKNQQKNIKSKIGSNPIPPNLTSRINIPKLKSLTSTKNK